MPSKHKDTTERYTRNTVLFAGVMAMVCTLGMGRFAYTPMIPYMQEQTGMGEALAGWLAGWNYLGYFAAVAIVMLVNNIYAKNRLMRFFLLLCVVSTPLMALSSSPTIWGLSRFLAGASSAGGIVLAGGMILHWLTENNLKQDLGIHFMGTGVGIVIGSLAVELPAAYLSWGQQWWVITIVALLSAVLANYYLPHPRSAGVDNQALKAERQGDGSWRKLFFFMYICAGMGYVVNATFTVVITDLQPALDGYGRWMWLAVGLVAIPATLLWDAIAQRVGYNRALQAGFLLQIVGILLPVFSDSLSAALASSLLFGFTFTGIVSLSMSSIGRRYPNQSSQMMAYATLGFAISQIIGPIIAGELAEYYQNFDIALLLVAGVVFAGFLSLLAMRRL